MNRINKIVNVLNQNKIKYNTGISRIYQDGIASEVCKSFSDEIITDLEKIIEYSVNNGFNKTKDTIDKLSDLLVAQTNRNAEQRLTRNKDIKGDILKDCKIVENGDSPIIVELDKLLYFSLEGVKLCRQNNIYTENENLFLDKYISLLEEIRENLGLVWNTNSKVAAEYQIAIYDAILENGESVGDGFFTNSILNNMERILVQIKSWQNDNIYNKEKISEYRTIKETKPNSLITAASTKAALEEFNSVKNVYNRYVNQTKNEYNIEELSSAIINLENKKNDINNNINACIRDVSNGIISKDIATIRLEDYYKDLNSIDENIDPLIKRKELMQKMYDSRTSIANQLSSVFENVDLFKSSPNKFYALTREADFKLIAKLLSGNITEEEVSNAIIRIQTIVEQYIYIIKKDIEISESFKKAIDTVEKEVNDINKNTNIEDNKSKTNVDQRFDAILNKLGIHLDEPGKVKKDTLPGEEDKNEAVKINKSTII